MTHSTVLSKGARITAGVFCLLFLLNTASWIAVDLAEHGPGRLWGAWAGVAVSGMVTDAYTVGLAVLQLAAVWAAFTAARAAGGILAVATTLTFTWAVQVFVSTGQHTSDNRWFIGSVDNSSGIFEGVFINSAFLILFGFASCIVLLAGLRTWPAPRPSDPPMRPAPAAGAVGAVVFGVIALCAAGWNVYLLTQTRTMLDLYYLGHGSLVALLSVGPGWYSVTVLVLSAVAALLCLARGVAARGFTVGLAAVLLPLSLLTLIAMVRQGTLFEAGQMPPFLMVLNHLQLLAELAGSAAVLVLMGRPGVPVAAEWTPPTPGAAFAFPGPQVAAPGYPAPGPQGAPGYPPAAGPQGPGYGAPGAFGAPGPQGPGYGYPAAPPQG